MNYMYPPRPKNAVPPTELPKYQATGQWVIQRKFKGTRNVIHITPERKVVFWNRHKQSHKLWTPTKEIVRQFLALDLQPGFEYWLDSELLHSKVAEATAPHLKNRIVLFDVLLVENPGNPPEIGLGKGTQMERLAALAKLCRLPTKTEPHHHIALEVSENIWLAQTFESDFPAHFAEMIHLPEIEGVVLRRRDSVIDSLGTKEYETSWQIRCRKPEGHYDF